MSATARASALLYSLSCWRERAGERVVSEANAFDFDFERQGQLAALAPLTRLRQPLPQGEARNLRLEPAVLHSPSRI